MLPDFPSAPWAYLAILVTTLICMVLCDFRWRLSFFHDARRAWAVSAVRRTLFLSSLSLKKYFFGYHVYNRYL